MAFLQAGRKPFIRGEDGKIPNLTAIANLCRADPRKAILLCKAAGENLDSWFPVNPK
ncbi:hypothetical protein MES5069_310114 [Mesorhizobium escarrei]|uniref:Uncharacterized protein n=1 Tax=Mesorhizobium escarrei TaxID=666018 RepID=A0ABN8JZB8_9HYPH|nr:hypothetical protein MES5069_310114 [Mesorhizobium escarrei]